MGTLSCILEEAPALQISTLELQTAFGTIPRRKSVITITRDEWKSLIEPRRDMQMV